MVNPLEVTSDEVEAVMVALLAATEADLVEVLTEELDLETLDE